VRRERKRREREKREREGAGGREGGREGGRKKDSARNVTPCRRVRGRRREAEEQDASWLLLAHIACGDVSACLVNFLPQCVRASCCWIFRVLCNEYAYSPADGGTYNGGMDRLKLSTLCYAHAAPRQP
jgi:hypothetical protein